MEFFLGYFAYNKEQENGFEKKMVVDFDGYIF